MTAKAKRQLTAKKLTASAPRSKPFQDRAIVDQVQRAMPFARAFLIEGIESDPTPGRDLMQVVIYQLTNDKLLQCWDTEFKDAELSALYEALAAARALGIALGLLMRPETFTGGAR